MNKKKFTKIELVNDLSKKTGFPVLYSKKLIEDLLEIFSDKIKTSNLILKNIGTFKLLNKNSRIGRNPKTKENFTIKAQKSISFISSNNLQSKLNKNQ